MGDFFDRIKSMNSFNESLVYKILVEAVITELPKSIKKLKTKSIHDIDINSIFKNSYSSTLTNEEGELEDEFSKNNGSKKYGASYLNTGMIKKNIPVTEIYPSQKYLQSENLLKILNLDHYESLPEAVVVNYNGKNYIVLLDGHHRVASEILKGKNYVELNLKVDNFK